MRLGLTYKNEEHIFDENVVNGVPYLSYPLLEGTGAVKHGFSTKLGGVSTGSCATMNISTTRGDDPEAVAENRRRIGAAIGVQPEDMTYTHQTHTTNVRRVTREDEGKGVIRERDYRNVDGLITDVPGITLVTFYADCVPLYLVDPVHHAIGLSHSGWRGTVRRMGQVTMDAMKEAFGTRPEDVTACIGPSICRDCFEVGEEVAEAFADAFDPKYRDALYRANAKPGKYQLDLWKANEIIFQEAGVPKEQIHTTNICTMCNSDYLFSHRRVGEERGNLAAFLSIR